MRPVCRTSSAIVPASFVSQKVNGYGASEAYGDGKTRRREGKVQKSARVKSHFTLHSPSHAAPSAGSYPRECQRNS